MKTKSLILCAMVLLMAQTIASAQQTEVSVQKGEVIAETANQSVSIGAGRKAILTTNDRAKVTVDSPLVEDALEIYKLI